jgi:hypothetical protein
MSSLSQIEMQKCEALLAVGGGYVLNFSSQNFDRFVKGTVGADIFSARYEKYGTSRAKRLRAYWEMENAQAVGKLIEQLAPCWCLHA